MTRDEIVKRLGRIGFRVNQDDGDTVYLLRKRGAQTRYADVEQDGTVSGMTFEDFLKSLKI